MVPVVVTTVTSPADPSNQGSFQRVLPEGTGWVVPSGARSSIRAELCSSGQCYIDDTWLMVLGENFFCHPVTRSGCLFGPTSLRAKNMPLQGEKVMPIRRRFASRGTWELFENSSAGNSLLRFCMWRTGKSLVIFFFFLHTVHPNKQFFLVYY